MAFKRVNLLSILKKIGAEFTDKIPDDRAVEKIKRIVAKKGLPDDAEWSKSEQKTLKKLKLLKKTKEAESTDEKPSKKKGKKKKSKTKREGNVAKAKRLIAEGKSEKEILKVFLADYKEQGKTDKEWCKKRVEIYIKIAKGGEKKKSKKDKGEKNKKKGDSEKSEKKGKKKKSKEKEEASDDEDEEDAD